MGKHGAVIPFGVGFGLFSAAAVAGPAIAAGGVLAVALAAAIYGWPVVGLCLMVLSGTALQILGSEHITGLPLSLGKIAGGATVSIWLLRSVVRRIPATWSPQVIALAGFLLAVWASGFVSPDPAESREGLFRYIQLALLTVMIANIAGDLALAIEDGRDGLLVDVGSTASLGAAVERLARAPELRAALGAAGHRTLAERFSPAAMLRQLEGFCAMLAEEEARRGR
ncbi:glycosyltransferase [Neoroseomonas soli]|uniref:Glycosyltransferase family 4 protein n=1 Tax=Neoroseomonas soli TaxID=1081025 RepID=A0A9X9WUV8_9PROT|nr:hypothetical protein [Neoroseomonas soli]MBR0670937.1 glycosyltransferase family 4 protein [Neoroseomonas soli]